MKPLFSTDEEVQATSAPTLTPAPSLNLAPSLVPSISSGMLPAARPEATAAPRVDISAIDDKAIEALGSTAGKGIAGVSARLLGSVRAADADEFGTQLNELIALSKGLDPEKLQSGGLISRFTSLFGSMKEKMLAQYEKVEGRMGTVVGEMERHANIQRQIVTDAQAMFKDLEQQYQVLDSGVKQGEKWMADLQLAIDQLPPAADAFSAQQATELKRRLQRLEKRVDDLRRGMLLASQMVPQIQLTQDHARSLTDTFSDIINVSIPAWTNVFTLYLLQLKVKQSTAVANAAYDSTEDAFRRQADMLLQNTEDVARLSQRSIVSLETAQHVQTQLNASFDKLEQITTEGRNRRQAERPQIEKLERELLERFAGKVAA